MFTGFGEGSVEGETQALFATTTKPVRTAAIIRIQHPNCAGRRVGDDDALRVGADGRTKSACSPWVS
jgi:hypothetical protein